MNPNWIAFVIERNVSIISRDVISDLHTTEFRMMLTLMIKVMQEIPEGSDILFLTNAAYIQNFDKTPTSKSAYKDKVVIVTGGAQGIGKCIAEEFRKQGALVEVIDKQEGLDHFVGDLSNKYAIEEFTKLVIEKYGKVDFIVNNALPLMKGIDECSY